MSYKAALAEAIRRRGILGLINYTLQAGFIIGNIMVLRLLPFEVTSAYGAWLFRTFGPILKSHRVARRNLATVFPDWDQAKIDATVKEVWDNLGRGAAEFAHLDKLDPMDPNGRVEITGLEHLEAAGAQGGFVIVSAHMANWEIASVVSARMGMPLNNIYRVADNPWMDAYIRKYRSKYSNRMIPKGTAGSREAFAGLKRGEPLGLLFDQKLNEGKPVPFFGRDAMTATAPIEMALKLKVPILPTRLERIEKTKFKVTIFQPLKTPDTGDRAADAIAILTTLHQMLEGWVRERPGQWFWVHKRWPN